MSDTIKALAEAVRGRVIAPSDPDYDDPRAVHNAMHDRKPRAVIRCGDSADVMAAVAAAQRVGASETAFGHRDKSFVPLILGIWSDPADNEANIRWVKDYYAAIHPHSGGDGGYVNFMSSDDDRRAPANYGANYERLAAVKATYDPDNLFHINQNIVPANRT